LGTPHIQLAAMPCDEVGVVKFAFSVSLQQCDYCACGAMTLRGVGGTGGKVQTTVKMCAMAAAQRVMRVSCCANCPRARGSACVY